MTQRGAPHVLTGTRIRERRLALSRRQADVARAAGISPAYLNLIEHNRRPVGADLVQRLAEVLQVPSEDLAEGREEARIAALRDAAALLRYEGHDAAWCSCAARDSDAHAGHTETSVLLHISPEVVRQDELVPGNRAPLTDLMPAMRRGGVAAVSSLGVLGDPTTATAEDGGRIFAEMVDGCVERVRRWTPDREGMLR